MKLPNDLIQATDYSKAKDREIHEFEYRNGKYIHKYVLGGEHEMTPQEVVDCLNGLATIDCDLQTAYAYIKGQKDKVADLETKLAEKNSEIKVGEFWHSAYQGKQLDYDKVYAELRKSYDENEKLKQELNKWSTEYARAYVNRQNDLVAENQQLKQQLTQCELYRKFEQEKKDIAMKRVSELKQQLAKKETRIAELEDKDWYEGTIKQLEEQNEKLLYKVAEKEKEIITLNCVISEIHSDLKELQEFKVGDDEYDLTDKDARFSLGCELLHKDQDKISFAVEQLEKVKKDIDCYMAIREGDLPYNIECLLLDFANKIDNQIEELKKEMK